MLQISEVVSSPRASAVLSNCLASTVMPDSPPNDSLASSELTERPSSVDRGRVQRNSIQLCRCSASLGTKRSVSFFAIGTRTSNDVWFADPPLHWLSTFIGTTHRSFLQRPMDGSNRDLRHAGHLGCRVTCLSSPAPPPSRVQTGDERGLTASATPIGRRARISGTVSVVTYCK
jgi:hypothetical protein